MRRIPYLAVLPAVLALAGLSSAQGPSAGTTPGTGAAAVDLCAPAAVQAPLPAECLCEPACQPRPWLVFAPYAWVPGVDGEVGVGHRTAVVDSSVSNAFDQLDAELRGAAQLHAEAGYGSVGGIVDLTYVRLVPLDRNITVDFRATLLEVLGLYRVYDTGRRAGGGTLDLLAGVRYYRFTTGIEGNVLERFSAERTDDWVDLVVGVRAAGQLKDDLGVFIRADCGGFGLGNSSDRACNLVVGFEWWCCECASLVGGYRWLLIDRDVGSGRDRFLLDVTLSGPFVAFALRY